IAARLLLAERGVAVGVQVDEAGRDDQAGRVEDLRRAGRLEAADGDDPLALDRQVALDAWGTGAVVQRRPAEDKIGLDGGVGGGKGEAQQERSEVHGALPAVSEGGRGKTERLYSSGKRSANRVRQLPAGSATTRQLRSCFAEHEEYRRFLKKRPDKKCRKC